MSPPILVSLLLLPFLPLTVNGRPHPCDTLIISTFTFSLRPHLNPNPNINLPHPDVIITTSDIHHHHHLRHRFFLPHHAQQNNGDFLGFASLKDRTKDILSVVVSLVFGAACGALTAATMYLVWCLFHRRSYRSVDGFDDDDGHDDPDSDVFNPKKDGYVAIPTTLVAGADPVPAPAKESA